MEVLQEYEVDGKKISKEEFEEMQKDSNIRLKEVTDNSFKTLKKLQG
jgi:hypothetical protein